jgi:LEA14-like dessication related protein
MRHFAIALFFMQLLNSCNAITVPKIVSIDSVNLKSDENHILSMESTVSIDNSNRISIAGRDLKFNVFFQSINLGSGLCSEEFKLNSKSITAIPISFQLYLDSIPEELRMKLFEMDSIQLNMQVSFQGKLGMHHTKEGEFYLKMSDLHSALISSYVSKSGFELKDMKLETTNMNSTKFSGNFSFQNNLPMSLLIKKSEVFIFNLRKGGVKIGDVEISENLNIDKDSIANIPAKMIVDNLKAASTGFGKVLSGSLDYFAKGNVVVTIHELDFKIPIDIHFIYYPLSGKVKILDE